MSILKYFLPLLLLITSSIFGQEKEEDIVIFSPAIRIGFDGSGLIYRLFQPETMQLEFTADFEFKRNWFVAAEAGYLDIDVFRDNFDYAADGLFLRLGVDYNVLKKKEAESNENVLISLRYGYSGLSHSADRVHLFDPYWGDFTTSMETEIVNSHWIDLGFGLKTELFRNIFLGWSVRGRYLLYQTKEPTLEPYNLPGFGAIRKNNTGISLHYVIAYRLPL